MEYFEHKEMVINGSELLDHMDSYEEWLQSVTENANSDTVHEDWVLTDTFIAVDQDNDEIIGIIDLRHELKGFLVDFGNTGYSVRPSERRKGYTTEMLKQLKEVAKGSGLKELHLSVERSNLPSIKTIQKNGCILERSFVLIQTIRKVSILEGDHRIYALYD